MRDLKFQNLIDKLSLWVLMTFLLYYLISIAEAISFSERNSNEKLLTDSKAIFKMPEKHQIQITEGVFKKFSDRKSRWLQVTF